MITPAIVLGEGEPDEKFINKVAKAAGLPEFGTRNPRGGGSSYGKAGFGRRLMALRTETNVEEQKAVLIIADNDDDPAAAFHDIQKQIRESNKDEERQWGVPTKPRELATSSGSLPSIGVLMVPWDDEQGCLETLCFDAAKAQRPDHAKCVEDLVKCAKAESWVISSLSKLRMRVMTASLCEKDPNTGLQYIWTEGRGCPTDISPLNSEVFKKIVDYLSKLGT